MAAAAMAPPPTSARLCPPRLTTTMTWQPPSVEDTVDEGEEDQETPCAKDLLSPATLAALATPATSVTSFESDMPDEMEDNLPPRRHSSAIPRAASRPPSYRSNTSAPLARRASSHQSEHPFPRDDDASTRVIPEARTDDGSRDRQVGGSAIKSQNSGLQLPPSPAFHSTVSRITPATLCSIFPPNTAPLSINTSPTATSPLCLSPSMSAADMPSPLSPSDRPKVRFRDRGPPVIHSQARPTGPRTLSSDHQSAPNAAPQQQQQQGWGILFDEGYSTPRLGHVLRGLAALVISRFGSAGDVVVTPKAMRSMYTKYTLGNVEVWYYHAIFDQSCLSDIGALYRDMECQHHLFQESPRSRPNVPGLTVDGWATWMAANILAYPDQEHHRLNKMVADLLPLTIPDGPNGELLTLPTTLPRHCFPATSDRKTRVELGKAIEYVLRDGKEAYVTSRPSRESRYNQGSSSRPGSYTYQADSRVSRYSVPRSNTDIRTTSMSRSYPFDSRIRTRTPVPDNRNAASSPNIGRSMTSATTTPRDSRRRSRRNDDPTYEDYFQAACRHSRDLDSSPERSSRSRRHSDDRGERRRRD